MAEPKKARPKIEDVIVDFLSGDSLKNALDFIAYLKENKMSPQWSATNSWKVSFKAHNVCFIRLSGAVHYHSLEAGSWHIRAFIGEFEDYLPDDYKEIVWSNIRYCNKCSSCNGKRMVIFGKEIDNVCDSIVVKNPSAKAIECIKKIIPMRKNAIQEGKVKKYIYVPSSKRTE